MVDASRGWAVVRLEAVFVLGQQPAEGRNMLVRVLTAHVAARNVSEANIRMRELQEERRAQPGLVYAKLARRLLPNDDEEMIVLEEWLTPGDLFRWTGGHLQLPRLPEHVTELFQSLRIAHYEALDRAPEELDLEIIDRSAGPE